MKHLIFFRTLFFLSHKPQNLKKNNLKNVYLC